MMAPLDNPLFDLQRTIYNSSNYTRRRLHQTRLRWVSDAIIEFRSKTSGEVAIEYGPGSGVYLPILAKYFREVVGADVEAAYLNGIRLNERQIDGLTLITDDILQSNLKDRSFDMVLCSEVLEHVSDPQTAIRTIYRILKPGGIAILTTPQKYSVLELCCKIAFLPGVIQVIRSIYGEPILEAGHISLMSRKQFEYAVQAAGFKMLKEEQFGLYVPLVAEFFGETGGRTIEKLERDLARRGWTGPLWTQSYVLQRPAE